MTKRLYYIDIAKGLCILLVVMGHILQFNSIGHASQTVFNFIYSFHMPVFMLLSGFVASLSRDNIDITVMTFVRKKFVSLVIPFLTWGLFIMPIVVYRKDFFSLPTIAKDLILQPDTGAWFIISLFCIQIYYLLFCCLANFSKKWMTPLSAECFSIIVVLSVLFISQKIMSSSCPSLPGGVKFYMPEKYILFFFLGYVFNRYLIKIVFDKWTLCISSFVFVVIVRYYTFGNDPYYLQVSCGILASIIVLNIAKAIEQNIVLDSYKRNMIIYGKNSLIIYLTHFPIVMLLQKGVCVNTDFIAGIPLFIIAAIVSVPICKICTLWGEIVSENSIFSLLLYGTIKKRISNKHFL